MWLGGLVGCGASQEEPVCGEDVRECPAGTYSVAWSDAQPGEDASEANAPILEADVGYLQFDDGECRYTCETVARCPGWTWPVVTADCAYCATSDGDGDTERLGGASGEACGVVPHPGLSRIEHDKTVIVGSRAQGLITGGEFVGVEQFWWEQADGQNLCTVSYDLITRRTDVCTDCDFSFELELTNGREVGDSCGALGVRGSLANGDTISMGYAAEWETDGRFYDDVLFWEIEGSFTPYYYGHWSASTDHFSYEKVWGSW